MSNSLINHALLWSEDEEKMLQSLMCNQCNSSNGRMKFHFLYYWNIYYITGIISRDQILTEYRVTSVWESQVST